jgi:hypothetical protein
MVNCKYVMPDHKCINEENIKLIQSITAERDRLQEALKSLKKLTVIQKSSGNWNYDAYMQGMANGMILAVNCFEKDKEPEFLEAPKVWLKDTDIDENSIASIMQIG